MKIEGEFIHGVFHERVNRFLALVRVGEEDVPCHFPNPGRLKELTIHGAPVVIKRVERTSRKTGHDLLSIESQGVQVCIDSRLPNLLVREALVSRKIRELRDYSEIVSEARLGKSRVDFLLKDDPGCFLEAKSCTLVKGRRALFPDAPTKRGERHLRDLMEALREGYESAVLFVVQRSDAKVFSPNYDTDPRFSSALREAFEAGVKVLAYTSRLVSDEISLAAPIEIDFKWTGDLT